MTRVLSFFVPGRPFRKQRPRVGMGNVYTHPETVAGEAAWRWYAIRAMGPKFVPMTGPLRIEVHARFECPKRGAKPGAWHTTVPDGDNVLKMIDALNPPTKRHPIPNWPGVWNDDAQLSDQRVTKRWADADYPEGTTVIVSEIDA